MKDSLLKGTLLAIAVGVSVLAGLINLWIRSSAVPGSEYRTFYSPDRRFKVVVLRSRQLFVAPGQAGDAPGNVCLYEVSSGKLIARKQIEMVQLIEQVTWSATNVEMKLFADWKLP